MERLTAPQEEPSQNNANWAFVVLVIAVLATIALVVNYVDFDTEVVPAEETLLPNVYTDEATGYSFRYPRGWQAQAGEGGSVALVPPENQFGERPGQIDLLLQSYPEGDSSDTASRLIDFQASLSPTVISEADLDEEERNGLESQVYSVTDDSTDTVNYTELIRLTDEAMIVVRNPAPIDEAAWDDLKPDLDRVLSSLDITDFEAPQPPRPAFIYDEAALPAGWAAQSADLLQLEVVHESQLAALVLSANEALALEANLMGPSATGDADPRTLLESFRDANASALTIEEDVSDVSYFGFDGAEITFSQGGQQPTTIAIVDPQDEYLVVVQKSFADADARSTYSADMDSILATLRYNLGDAPSELPAAEAAPEATAEATPELSAEATAEPTAEATVEATPIVEPDPTEAAAEEAVAEVTAEAPVEATPEAESATEAAAALPTETPELAATEVASGEGFEVAAEQAAEESSAAPTSTEGFGVLLEQIATLEAPADSSANAATLLQQALARWRDALAEAASSAE